MQTYRSLALATLVSFCLGLFFSGFAQAASEISAPANSQTLSLSLKQAVELGLKNNRDLQTARRAINTAASSYRAALAGYYPQIVGSVSSSHGLVRQLELQPSIENRFSAGIINLSLIFPLDLNGAIGRAVQQALIGFISVKASYSQAAQTLLDNIFTQYTDILRAEVTIKIDQAQVSQAAEQLRIANLRLKKGRIPEADVLTAKVQLDNARLQLKLDENAYDIAAATLRNTLVLNQHIKLITTDSLTFYPEKFNYDAAVSAGATNRLEMQIARLNLESARIALTSTYDQYKPFINITGSYGYNIAGRNPSEAIEQRPAGPLWEITATLTVPIFIFDGGVIKESKVRAITAIEQAQANIQQTEENIALDVKNQLVTLQNTEERVGIMRGSIRQAQESLRIAEMRYRLGIASYLELTDTRNNLRTAELNTLNAIRDHTLARARMYRAIGLPLVELDHVTSKERTLRDLVNKNDGGQLDSQPVPAPAKIKDSGKPTVTTTSAVKKQRISPHPDKAKILPAKPPSEQIQALAEKTAVKMAKKEPPHPTGSAPRKDMQSPKPGSAPIGPSQKANDKSSLSEDEMEETCIKIFNGSGTPFLPGKARYWLRQEGFNKVSIGRTRFEAEQTLVYHRAGAARVARFLKANFFKDAHLEESVALPPGLDINIILGSDQLNDAG
ncbi:MAG: TolC family protein [Syntrophales bacterium]|nr:TolC family protein [Syntrophales bacterium]